MRFRRHRSRLDFGGKGQCEISGAKVKVRFRRHRKGQGQIDYTVKITVTFGGTDVLSSQNRQNRKDQGQVWQQS